MNRYTFKSKANDKHVHFIWAKDYAQALAHLHVITDSGNYMHTDTQFTNENGRVL